MQCRQLPKVMYPRQPAGKSSVTVYAENWSAERQTVAMASTFIEWVAGSDAHMTAEMGPPGCQVQPGNQSASIYVLSIQAATALGPCMRPAATRSVFSCTKATC